MTDAPLSSQIFGIPTYDALFKHILSDDTIRASFVRAYVPDLKIESSTRVDEHMNPVQKLQLLRGFIHRKHTTTTINRLNSLPGVLLGVMDQSNTSFLEDKGATNFFKKNLDHFPDMRKSFPKAKYDATMDFVCQPDNGECVMVEMQVAPHNCWDMRALSYVAGVFGNQLPKGGDWKHIKNVIGINILGGGNMDQAHWTDTPGQYVRHYKVQEQLHKDTPGLPQRYIPGLELYQYSIMNAPDNGHPDSEKQDWITFFKRAHRMTQEEVTTSIKTPEVLQAFQKAKLDNLPRKVRKQYVEQDLEFDRYSDHTNNLVSEGEHKKASEMVRSLTRRMLVAGLSLEKIVEISGLTTEEVETMKS
jgi:predicted transposase/invertase (TIGR01784 family)